MKRFCSLLLAALILCALWFPAMAEKDDPFDRSYTRFNDYASTVTEEEEKQLNAKVRAKIDDLQMDLPVCVFYSRSSETTLSEFADDFYTRNKFGCGADKSGVLLVVDTQNAKFDIFYYGEAETLIGSKTQEWLSDSFMENCHDDDLTWYDTFDLYYDDVFHLVEFARRHPTSLPRRNEEDALPSWYPEQIEGFRDYHAENLPVVVDEADIFTQEQYETLTEKISDINERFGIRYVAYTTDDNYGFVPEELASDFLHFNGYGIGEEYGAVVFFLTIDPDDRCWLTISINSYEQLFPFDVIYEIDETVDSSIRGGAYYEAFLLHADFVESYFSNMTDDLPAWYPEGTRTFELDRASRSYAASADPDAPRIVDNAGMLSEEQRKTCGDALQNLAQQYGVDLVIFTDSAVRAPDAQQYGDDFYYYNGYGADGICLYLFGKDDLQSGTLCYGKCRKYQTLDIADELRGKLEKGRSGEAVERYIKLLTFVLKHDRLPMPIGAVIFCLIVGLVNGLIAASIVLSSLKRSMKITQTVSAGSYLVDGSFRLLGNSHHYLYSTVSKRAKPKETSSSSGSSSGGSRGGSSYSSGRSSGGSYSGGGRRF